MPEHVHLLISEPPHGSPSTVLQKLKRRVAFRLRKHNKHVNTRQMRLPFEDTEPPQRAFWQARFYDFNVYTKGKKFGKLNYMRANPVSRRLVTRPKDWPWSSWASYWSGAKAWIVMDREA